MKNANEQHPNWKPPEDFNFEKLEEIGFDDISWGNDAMPCFGNYKTGYTLWVDYVEKDSEFMGQDVEFVRYHLSKRELDEGESEHECLHDDAEHVQSSNEFEKILEIIKDNER